MWIRTTDKLPEPGQECVITGWANLPGDAQERRFRTIAIHSAHKPGQFYDEDTGDIFFPPTHYFVVPSDKGL
jgi:hypothetical protein